MSPAESGVKISSLGYARRLFVNDGENEAGTHKILSHSPLAGLHIGRCDSKDSPKKGGQIFLVNATGRRPIARALAHSITI